MGKKPNASRQKVNHRNNKNDSDEEDKLAALQEEAARLNCEVWEIDEVKKKLGDMEINSSDEEEEKEQVKQKKPTRQ